MPKRKPGVIKGTRVKGKGRVKVVTPMQADVKRWTKEADELAKGSRKMMKATGGSKVVTKPKRKAAAKPVLKKVSVKVAKPKGVKARGMSVIKKYKARLKKY